MKAKAKAKAKEEGGVIHERRRFFPLLDAAFSLLIPDESGKM